MKALIAICLLVWAVLWSYFLSLALDFLGPGHWLLAILFGVFGVFTFWLGVMFYAEGRNAL